MVNNTAETLVGGMYLSDERLVELMRKLEMEIPDELTITPDKEPWAMTFTQRLPFSARFADDTVTLAIRGSQFRRGGPADGQVLDRPMEISATYQLAVGQLGARLTRQGEVNVDFLRVQDGQLVRDEGRLSATQIGFRTFMRRKFEAMFKSEIASQGLTLPEQLQERLGQLRLAAVSARDGWVLAGWNVASVPSEQAVAVRPASRAGRAVGPASRAGPEVAQGLDTTTGDAQVRIMCRLTVPPGGRVTEHGK